MNSSTNISSQAPAPIVGAISGVLHIFVAFDWGEEVDLAAAARLLPAQKQELARRRRTPTSIKYHPAPLGYDLPPTALQLAELGAVQAQTEATVFDFGAVSVALRVPFTLTAEQLTRLAGSLSEPAALVESARQLVLHLYATLLPTIRQARLSPLNEEYFVFEVPPGGPLPSPQELLNQHAAWLAGLARLETESLSDDEIGQATAQRISYSPDDLFLPDWSAAVLLDRQCDETLQTIELSNLQLLEFRFIDQLLDDRLSQAYRLIQPLTRGWLPFWRTHTRPLRELGQLKIDAHSLFERTGNALKLVGDQYLARVHRMLAQRFHLESWQKSIAQSLAVVEDVYRVVADQATTYRTEMLEIVVILLIGREILIRVFLN